MDILKKYQLGLDILRKLSTYSGYSKGGCQKLLGGFFPLSFFGHNDFPLRGEGVTHNSAKKKNSYFWPKNANFSPF